MIVESIASGMPRSRRFHTTEPMSGRSDALPVSFSIIDARVTTSRGVNPSASLLARLSSSKISVNWVAIIRATSAGDGFRVNW